MARKTAGKASGKGKTSGKDSAAQRTARRVAGTVGKADGKAATKSAATKVTVVGSGAKGHTVVTAEQLASTLGISGKRLRGWLRGSEALGNDGVYTRYGIDADHKDGKALIASATARFKR